MGQSQKHVTTEPRETLREIIEMHTHTHTHTHTKAERQKQEENQLDGETRWGGGMRGNNNRARHATRSPRNCNCNNDEDIKL